MNREGAPGKSPEDMYIQQKVRVLLMLRKMGSNLTASEEEFLRTYAGVVNTQLSQLPQHSIDQGPARPGPRDSHPARELLPHCLLIVSWATRDP
ncbi:beta-catenin-interacting protein 1 [Crocuta crocuta]